MYQVIKKEIFHEIIYSMWIEVPERKIAYYGSIVIYKDS